MKAWGIKTEAEWKALSRDEKARKMAFDDLTQDMEAAELRDMRDQRKPLMIGAKTAKEDDAS